MPGHIPENILEDILSRIDIVEVISGFLPLKRAGRNFRALCPFHHEKTPSFMISPDRQIYHCFGCGESGNAFKFLMSYERMEFPEAAELLAKKAGVVLPSSQRQDDKAVSLASQIFKANELAALYYENNLNSPAAALAKSYLLKRGINKETAKEFQLGFASDNWDGLINCLRAKSVSIASLEKAGLVMAKESGGYYDRFRNRIIFPVFDIKQRVLGFGARVTDGSLPKYINSPETPVYTKGKNLYGLNLSKDPIRDNDCVAVVEGYLDFITPYQAGFKNIVASLGTALTVEQARLLKRYTHNVVMVYDADKAGEIATLRTLDIFIEEEMDVRVATFPAGFDPDSFVRQKGIEEFKERIKQALGLFDYKLKILKGRYDFKAAEGKRDIAKEMLETIDKFKNAILKSEYAKRLSEELGVAEHYILEELGKVKGVSLRGDFAKTPVKKILNISPTEKLLIRLMVEHKDFMEKIKAELTPADFSGEAASRIVSVMYDLSGQGKSLEPRFLMQHLGEEEAAGIISESMFLPEANVTDKEKMVDDCIKRIKTDRVKFTRESLHNRIKEAQKCGDEGEVDKLMQEFHNLITRSRA